MSRFKTLTQESFTVKEITQAIDHTQVMPTATKQDLISFCDEVVRYNLPVAVVACKCGIR